MVNTKLKNKVLEKIKSIDQNEILEDVLDFLESGEMETFIVPSHHIPIIQSSLQDFEAGNIIDNTELEIEVKKWLLK